MHRKLFLMIIQPFFCFINVSLDLIVEVVLVPVQLTVYSVCTVYTLHSKTRAVHGTDGLLPFTRELRFG